MKGLDAKYMKERLLKDLQRLRSPQGYLGAGIPHYKTLFGRDALISAWQLLVFDPTIAKNTLRELAQRQGKIVHHRREEEPGKILHEYRTPSDAKNFVHENIHFRYWSFPYYGSVESTMLFVILAEEYLTQTADTNTLQVLWPSIKKALSWIETYGDKDRDGLIEYQRSNPHGLYQQGWRDSPQNLMRISLPTALVETQGYAYLAYRKGAELAKFFNEEDLARHFLAKARHLKREFNKRFWHTNAFLLALDGNKNPNHSSCSNQGHLLFTGIIADRKKERKLVARLFESDLWTPYGIRTLSSQDRYFNPRSYHMGSVWPHDNWIISFGLKQQGYQKEAEAVKEALLRAYRALGSPVEFYGVVNGRIVRLRRACTIQAWTVGALLNLVHGDEP